MSKCPVCNAALTISICPVCGYDRSRDYAQFPTFGPLRGSVRAISRTASPPMLCPGCGGAHFLLHRDATFTCASCGKKLELPQIRALTHTGISSVYAGKFYTGAITSGGSAAVVGDNDYGQCDVGDWTDLKALALGHTHTVGLKKDGTILSAGCNVGPAGSGWLVGYYRHRRRLAPHRRSQERRNTRHCRKQSQSPAGGRPLERRQGRCRGHPPHRCPAPG